MTEPTTVALHREGHALRITLDRPESLNALSFRMLEELRDALEGEAADESVRAVMITGAGRGFCSGADLGSGGLEEGVGRVVERLYNPVIQALAALEKPVVAAVNGVAAGAGLSLAVACDVRLASRAAVFTLGFPRIGLVMDASCSYRLPRLIGPGRTLELAYSGRRVEADEAQRIGLVEALLEPEGFPDAAWEYVRRLADGPTRAFALVKRQVAESDLNDLGAQLALEARLQGEAGESHDFAEGIRAFREKRPPRFEGN